MKHLVFYDGTCGLCDRMVQALLSVDQKKQFLFAPLEGETAKKFFSTPLEKDTFVLVQDFGAPHEKIYLFGKGAFRVFWLLGGFWKILGAISFLPSFLYDFGYRFVAKNRHLFFKDACLLPDPKNQDRFLK